jgi:hypothetical protein
VNVEQLRALHETWHKIIEEQSWTKTDRAKLESTVEQLRDESISLRKVHRLLDALRSNRFLQEDMDKVYNEYRQKLKDHVSLLDAILSRRREIFCELKNHYLAEHRITLRDGRTVDCCPASSRSRKNLLKDLSQYSYELVEGELERASIVKIASDIERTMTAPTFINELLRKSVEELVLLLKDPDFGEAQTRRLLIRLAEDLVMAGHSVADLTHLTEALVAPGSDPGQVAKLLLLGGPTRWIVLASVDDIGLGDDESVRVGDITLRGVEHDFSALCNGKAEAQTKDASRDSQLMIKQDTIKRMRDLRGKVTAEIETTAYGPGQAAEKAVQAISMMIDMLAMQNPNIVVREPREVPLHRMIVLDSHRGVLAGESIARRLEISVKRNLGGETIKQLERIVQAVDQLLHKNPNDLNEFESSVLNAIHFYRKGNYAFDPLDKVVNYFVALESMLVMRGERPTRTLPDRVLEVLAIGQENVRELKALVEEAYRHRGRILHLGRVKPDVAQRVASELFEVNRRVIAILVGHLKDPRCDNVGHFLSVIRDERIVERERMLREVLLEINREYSGSGTLNAIDGAQIGEATLCFKYSDDGTYIYLLGTITKFTPARKLLEDVQSIDARFEGIDGDFKMELARFIDRFDLMELLHGTIRSVQFQARQLARRDSNP